MPDSTYVALICALAVVLVVLVVRRWAASWRARRRGARAVAGEGAAREMLEEAGYAVVAAQARIDWEILVDGEPFVVELRADYLVERDGETLVAEVKTGAAAPSLATAATRRQLLEYRVAFGVDGILLVVPERGTIQRVEFQKLPAGAGELTLRE